MYNLAEIYIDNNLSEDATVLFKRIIKEQKNNYKPYNNKVTLRAYSKLLNRYESQGENENVIQLIDTLKSSYPVSDFDLKDEYRLAMLYLKYGSETDGEELLKQIIDETASEINSSNENTLVKTYSKLLKIYQKRKDKDGIDFLIEQISQKYFIESLSPGNLYKLAVTFLKCGKKEEGSKLLEKISNYYSYLIYGRKALFLLGRTSQIHEDWDSAIKYFSEYIERYPDPLFFALKAYSRLIDSYWSRDANLELAQEETRKLADIVNDISDFETQLNLARDLKFKGMNELASATFDLGLSSAENFISENQDTYQALRAYWIIEKYAYALEKFDWVEENANSILEIVDQLKKTPAESKNLEKIEYIRSQTYLWLAKVCRKKKNYLESEKFLKKFIKNYPNDKEIDYVMYELGCVYEDGMQQERAIEAYRKVGNGMWKNKAENRLSELGFF
ncbi:MAG: tetratricopeptide repeat protein [Desulfobacterales bacterium]|nr:tetratricopeptide repeat protein [Desulfobacterales bacterium]